MQLPEEECKDEPSGFDSESTNEFGSSAEVDDDDFKDPPEPDGETGKRPGMDRTHIGSKTIFVTNQFRFFEDDYEKLYSIGEPGQFGTAYECYRKDDPSQTRVCVKEINKARFHHIPPKKRDEAMRAMQNEISILKTVEHENIVQLYDVYEDRHRLHLVMEYLPGGELFDRICEKGEFSEAEACRLLLQILDALDYMHGRDIVHLDLKPDNILFATTADDSKIKLIDFGMARVVPKLSRLKDRVGTPNYMAPEVLKGRYSKGADVWSVGVILFCMLFGHPPFYVDSEIIQMNETEALEAKIAEGFHPEVREGFGPWFSSEIPITDNCKNLLAKMLKTDVKERWTVKECLSSKWVFNRGKPSAILSGDIAVRDRRATVAPIIKEALTKFRKTNKFKVAVSRIFATHLDIDHLDSIRAFFKRLDTNGDGEISLPEFRDGMHKYFPELSESEIEAVFANIDMDDSRGITIDEMITAMSHRAMVDEDERLYYLFNELDKNGDGVLEREELEMALKSVIGDYERRDTYSAANPAKRMKFDKVKEHIRRASMLSMSGGVGVGGVLLDDDSSRPPSTRLQTGVTSTMGAVDYEHFLSLVYDLHGDAEMGMGMALQSSTDELYFAGSTFSVGYAAQTEDHFDQPHFGRIKEERAKHAAEERRRKAEATAKREALRRKAVARKQEIRQPTVDMFRKQKGKRRTMPSSMEFGLTLTPREKVGAGSSPRKRSPRRSPRLGPKSPLSPSLKHRFGTPKGVRPMAAPLPTIRDIKSGPLRKSPAISKTRSATTTDADDAQYLDADGFPIASRMPSGTVVTYSDESEDDDDDYEYYSREGQRQRITPRTALSSMKAGMGLSKTPRGRGGESGSRPFGFGSGSSVVCCRSAQLLTKTKGDLMEANELARGLESQLIQAQSDASAMRAECQSLRQSYLDKIEEFFEKMQTLRREFAEDVRDALEAKDKVVSERDETISELQSTIGKQLEQISAAESKFTQVTQEKMALLMQLKSQTDMFSAHMTTEHRRRRSRRKPHT